MPRRAPVARSRAAKPRRFSALRYLGASLGSGLARSLRPLGLVLYEFVVNPGGLLLSASTLAVVLVVLTHLHPHAAAPSAAAQRPAAANPSRPTPPPAPGAIFARLPTGAQGVEVLRDLETGCEYVEVGRASPPALTARLRRVSDSVVQRCLLPAPAEPAGPTMGWARTGAPGLALLIDLTQHCQYLVDTTRGGAQIRPRTYLNTTKNQITPFCGRGDTP